MQEVQEFREYLLTRNADESTIQKSISLVDQFYLYLKIKGYEFRHIDNSILTEFSESHIVGKPDAYHLLLALARFFRFKGNNSGLSHLLTMLGTNGVLDSIEERMKEILGEETADPLIQTFVKPPLGSGYNAFPPAVQSMLNTMQKELPLKTCQKILAGNHHRMPVERFNEHKEKYSELGIDGYLKWRHESMIESMESCIRDNSVWYEQVITEKVLDFVKANQEIQSGIRKGNTVYITKIPYNPDAYLSATDEKQKRSYACHCPFVRSSIADSSIQVAPLWCYCTGGFEKMPFDVIFGKELPVEVLQTVLGGDPCCRFAITLPDEAIPENEKQNSKS